VTGSREKTAECRYGADPNNLNMKVSAIGSTYTLGKYTSPILFKSTISGLEVGNKEYYYSVGSSTLGYSPVYSFKSHPGSLASTTFFVVGDLGQTSNSATTLTELVEWESQITTPSAGIISMGDLSYANGDEPLWDSFGNLRQIASATIPFTTTLGNHEWHDDVGASFTAYKARYDNPPVNGVRELYYSFNIGLAHWVMVAGYCQEMKTTASQPCLAQGSPQMTWLIKDLASVDRSVTPWVFVVFHEPYVNSNTAHSMKTEGYPMQAAIESVLNQYKVDVVFSGHVHAYERSCQVYNYTCTPGAPTYITIGDGGNAEGLATGWINPQPSWSAYRQASYGFGELIVINSTHSSWAWHQNQDLVPLVSDSLYFTRGSASSLRGVSLDPSSSDPVQVSREPVFVSGARGERAAAFNEEVKKVSSRWTPGH